MYIPKEKVMDAARLLADSKGVKIYPGSDKEHFIRDLGHKVELGEVHPDDALRDIHERILRDHNLDYNDKKLFHDNLSNH